MNRYQKWVLRTAGIISLWFGLSGVIFAQRIVNVPQGVGTLNTAIDGDTLANGDRVDPNTVYVLESGGFYITLGDITNRGYHLTVVAADGATEKPKIIPGVDAGGSSSRPFSPRGDLTLRGLYITNEDQLGGLNRRMIRVRADSVRIVIEDCHLDKSGQSAFRLDTEGVRIFMRNSIMSNIGTTADPNNGRGIDDRGNNIDTLIFVGNTFYNVTSRVVRDGGGWIKFAYFDHNTFVNVGQYILSFGEAAFVRFTNNQVVNWGFYGISPSRILSGFVGVEIDSIGPELIGMGLSQHVDLRNNNFYRDPAVEAVYPDTVEAVPLFNETAQNFVNESGVASTFLNEAIAFTNGPAIPTDVIQTFYSDPVNTPPLDTAGEPFDFAYPNTTQSFTHDLNNGPLGDPVWFGLTVGIEDISDGEIPAGYALRDNYPNPFNPETNIEYAIPQRTLVRISVFNLLGQKIATLVNREQTAGTYKVTWNGLTDAGYPAGSGIYFYRLETARFAKTKRMLLLQ